MNNTTVYVGMDVHKNSFSLCCYTVRDDACSHYVKIDPDYRLVLEYIESMRGIYGDDSKFICGYEAGCLGYTLYHQLNDHGVECIILAPSTMAKSPVQKKKKTDKRDSEVIARCLAHHSYHKVHVPTSEEEQIKEFIRMRDDHKLARGKIKQQILAFCLRHGFIYNAGASRWTAAHLSWLRSLEPEGLYKEILSEYLLTYDKLTDTLERLDRRIEELADQDAYRESVRKLCCFLGIKTQTALAVIVEVGDFKRFQKAQQFASYIGLVPGEDSSGDGINRLPITKAGNTHVRRLLVEAAQSYGRGSIGFKSKALKARQEGNSPEVIAYADKANERLRRRYYRMTLKCGKKVNVVKTSIARELACFLWGMMTGETA